MKYIRIGIYILIVFVFVIPFLVFPGLAKIKKIECYTQYGICSTELINNLDNSLGKTLSLAKNEIDLELAKDNLIEDSSFRFKLPDILRVDLILIKPKYAVFSKAVNKYALVNEWGTVLEISDNSNLPKVTISDNFSNVGETLSSDKHFALEIIYSLNFLYQIKEGEIEEKHLIVRMSDGVNVIFPLEGEEDILLGSMKLILSRLNQSQNTLKIGKVKEIDLRYKNPILRYN